MVYYSVLFIQHWLNVTFRKQFFVYNLNIGARLIPSEKGVREPLLDVHKSMSAQITGWGNFGATLDVRVTVTEEGSEECKKASSAPIFKKGKRKIQETAVPLILNFLTGLSVVCWSSTWTQNNKIHYF